MSTSKPRIRPKAESHHGQGEPPLRDPPPHPEYDPPVLTECDAGGERKAPERVIFLEDDCLR